MNEKVSYGSTPHTQMLLLERRWQGFLVTWSSEPLEPFRWLGGVVGKSSFESYPFHACMYTHQVTLSLCRTDSQWEDLWRMKNEVSG